MYVCMYICIYVYICERVRAADFQVLPSSVPQSCCIIAHEILLSSYTFPACVETTVSNNCLLRTVFTRGNFEMNLMFRSAPLKARAEPTRTWKARGGGNANERQQEKHMHDTHTHTHTHTHTFLRRVNAAKHSHAELYCTIQCKKTVGYETPFYKSNSMKH